MNPNSPLAVANNSISGTIAAISASVVGALAAVPALSQLLAKKPATPATALTENTPTESAPSENTSGYDFTTDTGGIDATGSAAPEEYNSVTQEVIVPDSASIDTPDIMIEE